MIVVAGLGNPGSKYENTKHNIGFVTVDVLADRHGIKLKKRGKLEAYIGDGMIAGKKVLLVEPITYMNDSGRSLRKISDYYDLSPEELIVIYDDVDLPVGSVRLRPKGGAGTHNGMRSILEYFPDGDFPRIRIGIGADMGEIPLYNWVLSGFSGEHLDPIRKAVLLAADAVETFISEGIDIAMNRHN